MEKVVIINYGAGNIHSINNAITKVSQNNKNIVVSNQKKDIESATKLILPGVGAFGACIQKLSELNLIPIIKQKVLEEKIPFLGICLGMQLLATKGYEFGQHEGLGFFKASVKEIIPKQKVAVPHMGWNNISIKSSHPMLKNIENGSDFYFVHSYHFVAENENDVIASVNYGGIELAAIVAKENIVGVQFHPEKSSDNGFALLNNFLNL
jgi:glutamine amidotransferase